VETLVALEALGREAGDELSRRGWACAAF
jgi:hypothetical protein